MTAIRAGAVAVALCVLAWLPGCATLPSIGGGSVALPALEPEARAPARVVLVTIAGLVPADYLPGTNAPAPMPTLASLAAAGAAAENVLPVAPAASYPAHATLVTGRAPARHGVTSDRLLGDRGGLARRPTPRSPLRTPALWDAVVESGRRSVVLGWPGSSGGRIDLVFPESFQREPGDDWSRWLTEHTSPGLLESAQKLGADVPATAGSGPERDRLLVGLACEALQSETPPALLLVHLSQAEPALALEGPGSPAARAALLASDRELARLVACLRTSGFLDSTALLVAGDHGALPVHTSVSPNVALREFGLIVPTVKGDGMQRWTAFSRSNGGSAFVYARSEADARIARRALEGLASRTGGFRVVAAREMIERGADPDAWFGLEAAEGFWIEDALTGPVVKPAPIRGSWGNVNGSAGLSPGFVAWGRGVRSGVRITDMRQTDVAPTVAVLLGFELGELDGTPLAAVLSLPSMAAAPEKEPALAP